MLNSISVLNLSGSSLPSFSGIFDGEARKASLGRCNFSIGLSYTVICWTFCFAVLCGLLEQSDGLRLLKDKGFRLENSLWLEQQLLNGGHEVAIGPYPMLNISGTYKGTWFMLNDDNSSARLPSFEERSGDVLLELLSSLTEIHGVHYVQGQVVLQDGMLNKKVKYSQGLPMRMEGVFVWPFRQLRLIYSSPFDGDVNNAEEFLPSNPYHLLGRFYLQVLQESQTLSSQAKVKSGAFSDLGITCKIQLGAQISQSFSGYKDVSQDRRPYEMHGLIESSMAVDDEDCFPAIKLNATSVNVEVYYNKAINYTLMVTFISFLQVLLLIRQMEHSNTQSGAAKVSLLMVGQQAILDAYLCLLHLTAGILVESLFNAFATAAFFKFVIFSIFEMRYLLAIWKARRPVTSGEGWEAMRRELSILYSRFYGFLLGGILIMYELHSILRYVLFVFYSFWIPQIVESIVRDSRKPLHPHYIIGMTLTRLAIPMYTFGCPKNFMRIETSRAWCIGLATLMTVQATILLVQHYFGARWFIPRKFLPEKYSYFRRVDHAALQTAVADEGAAVDCVICMAVVDVGQCSNECMVTPCDHVFHTGCLQRWMDIKMECPTCRRTLPPI